MSKAERFKQRALERNPNNPLKALVSIIMYHDFDCAIIDSDAVSVDDMVGLVRELMNRATNIEKYEPYDMYSLCEEIGSGNCFTVFSDDGKCEWEITSLGLSTVTLKNEIDTTQLMYKDALERFIGKDGKPFGRIKKI